MLGWRDWRDVNRVPVDPNYLAFAWNDIEGSGQSKIARTHIYSQSDADEYQLLPFYTSQNHALVVSCLNSIMLANRTEIHFESLLPCRIALTR